MQFSYLYEDELINGDQYQNLTRRPEIIIIINLICIKSASKAKFIPCTKLAIQLKAQYRLSRLFKILLYAVTNFKIEFKTIIVISK